MSRGTKGDVGDAGERNALTNGRVLGVKGALGEKRGRRSEIRGR